MLRRLGFKRFVYDWRHRAYPELRRRARRTQAPRHRARGVLVPRGAQPGRPGHPRPAQAAPDPHPALGHDAGPGTKSQDPTEKVAAAVRVLRPIADEAARIGCTVGLYNHGGWFGEPENEIAILGRLERPNVGLVYNLHHGHDHLDRFPALLAAMKPYLLALNLNGMVKDGEKAGKKILPLGQGDQDLSLLRTIRDSGYRGPIGIIGHTQDDAEERLQDNLDGLDWLLPQLAGKPPGPKPKPRTGAGF